MRLFAKTGELKPLLYTFHVLLTGIHLMRTGEVQAHLPTLLDGDAAAPSYLADLTAAKVAGEHGLLGDLSGAPDSERVDADVARLFTTLQDARAASTLPDEPSAYQDLHDLLVRIRLAG